MRNFGPVAAPSVLMAICFVISAMISTAIGAEYPQPKRLQHKSLCQLQRPFVESPTGLSR